MLKIVYISELLEFVGIMLRGMVLVNFELFLFSNLFKICIVCWFENLLIVYIFKRRNGSELDYMR